MRAPARDVRTRAPGGARSRRPRDAAWWWCMGLGLWFVCRCVGVGVLWGLLLVCVGVRVFLCVCVCVFCSRCVSFVLPSLWLVCVPLFGCVLRFRFCCVFLCGFLCFNGFPFAVLKSDNLRWLLL